MIAVTGPNIPAGARAIARVATSQPWRLKRFQQADTAACQQMTLRMADSILIVRTWGESWFVRVAKRAVLRNTEIDRVVMNLRNLRFVMRRVAHEAVETPPAAVTPSERLSAASGTRRDGAGRHSPGSGKWPDQVLWRQSLHQGRIQMPLDVFARPWATR